MKTKKTLTKKQTIQLLNAYYTFSELLFEYIDPKEIYKEEFLKSIDKGLEYIQEKKNNTSKNVQ
ncbi:MAG: hypothetical protein FJ218_09735 [Ignavibacteria bacterium]|nr:hypothetical protein [Ignavibacteria bacterium]